jgi:hypothetical protein
MNTFRLGPIIFYMNPVLIQLEISKLRLKGLAHLVLISWITIELYNFILIF